MNKVILIGNLGADAELSVTKGGKKVLKFSLATSFGSKEDAKTDWHRCTLFSDHADKLAPFMLKGKKVAAEGRVSYSTYEKDGEKKYSTDIIVGNVELLGDSKKNDSNGDAPEDWGK